MALVAPGVDPEGFPVTHGYAWTRDGTLQADLSTDTVPADRTAKGETWAVAVTPLDAKLLAGTPAAAQVKVVNSRPSVSLAWAQDKASSETGLKVLTTGSDKDGDELTFAFAWLKDGAPAQFSGDEVPGKDLADGQRWQVTVTPRDGEEDGVAERLDLVVGNTAPSLPGVTLSPVAPTVEGPINASPGEAADADGDGVKLKFTWKVNDLTVDGVAGAVIQPSRFAKGDVVQVTVTPSDGKVDGMPRSATVTVANAVPSGTAAVILPALGGKGTARTCVGQGWNDADGDAEAWQYAWKVDGVQVATGATLAAGAAPKGKSVTCMATPTDGTVVGPAQQSVAAVVANTPPVLASAELGPAVAREADTLSVTLDDLADEDGDAAAVTYAWYVDGVRVQGAQGSTLGGTAFARGQRVKVVVTPGDGTTEGLPVVSNEVIVQNTPPTLAGVTLQPLAPTRRAALKAEPGLVGDPDGDAVSLSYAWTVNNVPVTGQVGPSLSPSYFAKGQTVRVTVTPADGTDLGAAVTATVVVGNSAPSVPRAKLDDRAWDSADISCVVEEASTDLDALDTVAYSFHWTKNGLPFTQVISTSRTSTVAAVQTGPHDRFTCTVTASDGTASVDSPQVALVVAAGYEWEPNDGNATANDFDRASWGRRLDADINPVGDVDIYRFVVPPGISGPVTISVIEWDTAKCSALQLDSYLRVRNAAGAEVPGGTDDDSGEGFCSKLELSGLAAGTYTVEVSASPYASPPEDVFDYRLVISWPVQGGLLAGKLGAACSQGAECGGGNAFCLGATATDDSGAGYPTGYKDGYCQATCTESYVYSGGLRFDVEGYAAFCGSNGACVPYGQQHAYCYETCSNAQGTTVGTSSGQGSCPRAGYVCWGLEEIYTVSTASLLNKGACVADCRSAEDHPDHPGRPACAAGYSCQRAGVNAGFCCPDGSGAGSCYGLL